MRREGGSLPAILSANDENVARLALYLEHLERVLNTGGFDNFTEQQYQAEGFPPGFRDNIGLIGSVGSFHWTCDNIKGSADVLKV